MAAGADLTVTFSEAVKLGSGNITLTDGAGDVRIIAVTVASQVSLNGQVLTINPTADLHPSASSAGTGQHRLAGSGTGWLRRRAP